MGFATQDPGHGRAGVDDAAVVANHAYEVRGVLHQCCQSDLRRLDALLGSVQVGQVASHH